MDSNLALVWNQAFADSTAPINLAALAIECVEKGLGGLSIYFALNRVLQRPVACDVNATVECRTALSYICEHLDCDETVAPIRLLVDRGARITGPGYCAPLMLCLDKPATRRALRVTGFEDRVHQHSKKLWMCLYSKREYADGTFGANDFIRAVHLLSLHFAIPNDDRLFRMRDAKGNTICHWAARMGAERLVSYWAATNGKGRTALHYAFDRSHLDRMRAEAGTAGARFPDSAGETPEQRLQSGLPSFRFVETGDMPAPEPPACVDSWSRKLLNHCAIFSRWRLFEYMRQRGTRIHLARLMIACVRLRLSVPAIHRILRNLFSRSPGVDVNESVFGRNALSFLAEYMGLDDTLAAAKFLLDRGADYRQADGYGFVPMTYCSGRLRRLLSTPAGRNTGWNLLAESPLAWSLLYDRRFRPKKEHLAMLALTDCPMVFQKCLFENVMDGEGCNILHWLAKLRVGMREGKALRDLDVGGRVNETNDKGRTPLHYARTIQDFVFLVELGADNSVEDAGGHIPATRMMRRHTSDARNCRASYYRFLGEDVALDRLPEWGDGTDWKLNCRDLHGRTALHQVGAGPGAARMVERGADPDAVDIFGRRAAPEYLPSLRYLAARELSAKEFRNLPGPVKLIVSLYRPGSRYYEEFTFW